MQLLDSPPRVRVRNVLVLVAAGLLVLFVVNSAQGRRIGGVTTCATLWPGTSPVIIQITSPFASEEQGRVHEAVHARQIAEMGCGAFWTAQRDPHLQLALEAEAKCATARALVARGNDPTAGLLQASRELRNYSPAGDLPTRQLIGAIESRCGDLQARAGP